VSSKREGRPGSSHLSTRAALEVPVDAAALPASQMFAAKPAIKGVRARAAKAAVARRGERDEGRERRLP